MLSNAWFVQMFLIELWYGISRPLTLYGRTHYFSNFSGIIPLPTAGRMCTTFLLLLLLFWCCWIFWMIFIQLWIVWSLLASVQVSRVFEYSSYHRYCSSTQLSLEENHFILCFLSENNTFGGKTCVTYVWDHFQVRVTPICWKQFWAN